MTFLIAMYYGNKPSAMININKLKAEPTGTKSAGSLNEEIHKWIRNKIEKAERENLTLRSQTPRFSVIS